LVTGGAGFIGSHIVEHYLSKGDDVVVIDNLSTGNLENISIFKKNPLFTFFKSDILNWKELNEVVGSVDMIYHMAAVLGVYRVLEEPIEVLTTNIFSCNDLLKAVVATDSKARIIIASSSSVYGPSSTPDLKEDAPLIVAPNTHPLWGYAVSKIADEALVSAYCQVYKLPITSIIFFNTIGPRQTGRYGMVVPRFVSQAVNSEPLTVYGDGDQTRSFCDVRDSVAALSIVAEKSLCIGDVINIGNDREITINELSEKVLSLTESDSKVKYIPYKEAYGIDFNDIKQRRPNIDKLRKLTSFKHKWTLEDTIVDLKERCLEKLSVKEQK